VNQSISALIIGLGRRPENIGSSCDRGAYIHPDCKQRPSGRLLLQEPRTIVRKWRGIMKALIAALALVTLLASPTFAQTAATDNSPACGGYGWGPSSPCYGP
jgi:hypothetical protein